MADRLERIELIKRGTDRVKKHIGNSEFNDAVIVLCALLEQLLAVVENEDLNHPTGADATITFTEDCGDGKE
tara:strand:- start:474 stop:689 length:216 start_codon:yes stop_codon:yes gene_type:complete